MCVSTLPSPSLSVPCICGILQSPCRKSSAFSAKDHFAKVLGGKSKSGRQPQKAVDRFVVWYKVYLLDLEVIDHNVPGNALTYLEGKEFVIA